MSGVAVLIQLLLADSGVLALVPASRIVAGILPASTQLPAISVTRTARTEISPVKSGATAFVREQVQASVVAANVENQHQVQKAIVRAAHNKRPNVPALINVAVTSAGAGPDLTHEESSICQGSEDFMTHYNEVR